MLSARWVELLVGPWILSDLWGSTILSYAPFIIVFYFQAGSYLRDSSQESRYKMILTCLCHSMSQVNGWVEIICESVLGWCFFCFVTTVTVIYWTMTQKNQHKLHREFLFLSLEMHLIYFIAPDKIIKEPLTDYYAMGINNVEITKLLKSHYDTPKYGLGWVFWVLDKYLCLSDSQIYSVYTVWRLRKEWNILSTRKQKHTVKTIYAEVSNIRERHPLHGIKGIQKTLQEEQGMRVPWWERSDMIRVNS